MIDFIFSHGDIFPYVIIMAVLLLSSIGAPIPEEATVVTAGVLSARGALHPGWAFAFCWLGAVAGDCIVYWIGYHFGRSVLREHRWWAHFVTPQREERVERLLQQHGLKVLFVSRFLVGIRSPVYLAAGILRAGFHRFLLADLFCATIVVGSFFWLSFYFGAKITDWLRAGEILLTAIVVIAAIIAAIALWRRHVRKRQAVAGKPAKEA